VSLRFNCNGTVTLELSKMNIREFHYDLPPELIAQNPVRPRDHARMFVLHRSTGAKTACQVKDLPTYLEDGDVVVINDTRVIPAVLRGTNSQGGQISIKLVSRKSATVWDCGFDSVRPQRNGDRLIFGDGALIGTILEPNTLESGYLVEFGAFDNNIMGTLERIGSYFHPLHLPPSPKNPEIMQTVYAKESGSFQSPSAGLHMTTELLGRLRDQGITVTAITQHVGRLDQADFLVKDNAASSHQMYEEWYTVSEETASIINAAHAKSRRVLAIGTTVTRTLESVADEHGFVHAGSGWTTLFIRPGYRFRVVDALLSNFQSPMITTLILACAFGGTEQVMELYREAVRRRFRFLEYGDAALYI
jgi:S-adenosylmethionine:tRNA ribosyltransferase-isomerase